MAKNLTITENSVTLENVELLRTPFRNFSGSPTKFHPEGGPRSFHVRLTQEQAEALRAEKFYVRESPAFEEGEEPLWHLEIKVSFRDRYGERKSRPPRIVSVTPSGKKDLSEEVCGSLDSSDIEFADVSFRPYDTGRGTVTAYLQSGYFHVKLDALQQKYEMDTMDEVVCDEDGVCYLNGVRINVVRIND